MNTTRLIEIATILNAAYTKRAELSLKQWQLEHDLESRQLYLAPSEGWPGKNEAERKLAQAKTYQMDEACRKIEAQIAEVRQACAGIDASVSGLEAERRALEWEIRGELVKVLQQNHVEYSGQVEDFAFDTATQLQLDQAAFNVQDELPF
jgi:hypothetical protein